jgi:hypothetical protein
LRKRKSGAFDADDPSIPLMWPDEVIPAKSQIQCQAAAGFPVVLKIEAVIAAEPGVPSDVVCLIETVGTVVEEVL